MKPPLTLDILRKEAQTFALKESAYPEPSLYGTTDGKAVGTYLEHKFQAHLSLFYNYIPGKSSSFGQGFVQPAESRNIDIFRPCQEYILDTTGMNMGFDQYLQGFCVLKIPLPGSCAKSGLYVTMAR